MTTGRHLGDGRPRRPAPAVVADAALARRRGRAALDALPATGGSARV
jgi:hypothetical protein